MSVLRAGEHNLTATNANAAGVGLQPASKNLDQRALAGPVLSDKRMDLSRIGGE